MLFPRKRESRDLRLVLISWIPWSSQGMTILSMNNNLKPDFQTTSEMLYANSDFIKNKSLKLIESLKEYLKSIKQDESLFFNAGETVYVPDIHGDFIHMIITLYRHGVLTNELDLKKDFKYVFLGDFYDRAPDSDVMDFWLNNQIKNRTEIYRLIGNHEYAFLMRKENGHPIIFPSQDAIRDMSSNF